MIASREFPLEANLFLFQLADKFLIAAAEKVILATANPKQFQLRIGASRIGQNRCRDCPPPMLSPAMARWVASGSTR